MKIRAFILLVLMTLTGGLWTSAQDDAPPPRTVTVGIYINDIQAIDLRTHSYGLDFYLWFRWTGDDIDPSLGFELMNRFDPEAHVEEKLYDEPKAQPDGSFYQIVRHQGLFSSKFPVGKYPFDSQRLLISVEDVDAGAQVLQYVPDTDVLVLNPEIELPGSQIQPAYVEFRDKPYATAFGDLAEADTSAYARAEFFVPIRRPVIAGIFKTFVPVFLIVLAAAFALLLDPTHVEARIGLAITALLTLVAMQFTMQAGLPEVAYLTLLDQVYLISYLYVLVVIGLIVRGTRIDEQGSIQGGDGSLDRLVRAGPILASGVTGIYMVVVLITVAANLAV